MFKSSLTFKPFYIKQTMVKAGFIDQTNGENNNNSFVLNIY